MTGNTPWRFGAGLAVVLALTAGQASAEVIAEHIGSNDPTSGSDTSLWTSHFIAANEVSAQPGPPASWRVSGGYSYYQYVPTGEDHDAIEANGFKLSVNIRVPNINEDQDYSPYAEYASDNGVRYTMVFGSNSDGEPIVSVKNITAATSYTVTGGTNSEFHLYELVYDPDLNNADLFVDGVERLSDITPGSGSQSRVIFGGNNGGGSGTGDFNLVRLETVPEPASLSLLTLGTLLIGARRKR